MRLRDLGLATATATVLLLSKSASAQTAPYGGGFDLQQFSPTPAGDRFFATPDATVIGKNQLYVGVLGDYALKPLKLHDRTTDTNKGYITSTQLYANVDLAFAISNRVLLAVDLPFALAQSGDTVSTGVGNATIAKPSGGKLGDIKATARINLVGNENGGWKAPFALAVQGDVWFPSGDEANLTGDQKARFNPKLIASGEAGLFIYTLNAGYDFRHYVDLGTPKVGPGFTFGASAGVLVADRKVQLGVETYGQTVVHKDEFPGASGNTKFFGNHDTPAELLGEIKVRVSDIVIGAGAGPGLTKTPGTPAFRALLGIFYAPEPVTAPPPDRDNDGIPDAMDACPDTPGVRTNDPKTNGCPPPAPDRDGDGIPDAQDACPDVPGVANADPAKNGCPADRDGDTIPDTEDACPDVPGVKNADPKKNGCPADRDGDGIADNVDACPDTPGVKSDDPKKNGCPPDKDGDGILDKDDACPDVPGVADKDPKKNGCPAAATIVGNEIKLGEQVHFQTGKATILPDSDTLLTKVAEILTDHPELKLVSIEGHTDSKGNKAANKALSKSRAESVKKWLTTKGKIDAKRLQAAGYGQERPIASNDTDEGRAQNRRVEIHILKRDGDAAAPATAKPAATPAKPPPIKKKLAAKQSK